MTGPHFDLGPTAPASALEAAEEAESAAKHKLLTDALAWTTEIGNDPDTFDAGHYDLLMAAYMLFTDRREGAWIHLEEAARKLAAAYIDSRYAAALDAAREGDDAP